MFVRIAWGLALAAGAWGQTVCPPTPKYTPCDLVFDVPSAGAKFSLSAEMRSPHHDTAKVNAFQDGPSKWIIRFSPAETGEYAYHLTSSDSSLNDKEGTLTATQGNKVGWLRAANVHHFALLEGTNMLTPHLWMGAVVPGFTSMDGARWKSLVDARAAQHFNHFAVTLVDESAAGNFQSPEFFRTAEEKIRYANEHGILVDIAFFGPDNLLTKLLPSHENREKWFSYALSRLPAFDVTWQGVEAWETYDNPRELLKEISGYLAALDPYKRTRSTRTLVTSAPFADDGWLRYRSYQTADIQVGTVEGQVYTYPAVNNFGQNLQDGATFRKALWRATMSGQYPATLIPGEQAANAMKVWYEFMQTTRHWELEPFFDVENGSAVALDGIEYVIYVENPASPVTVTVEPHGYDAEWINPATGEHVKSKEKNKGENYSFTAPDASHDWILHVSREGTKAGMLKSVKFDSREPPFALQVPEGNPEKIPFEVAEPADGTISLSKPPHFAVKLKRQTKALESMMYEWTGEVTLSQRNYRVIGTGKEGTFRIPPDIAIEYPAALHVKVTAMNGLGKVYIVDRNYTLVR